MPAAPLPPLLDEKLTDLAAEVRRLRVVRGSGRVPLALVGGAALAVGLDAAVGLPGVVRGVLFAGWLGLAAFAGWRWVARPLRGPVPAAELAARVEQTYPGLAERLTTLVELSEQAGRGNGSRA